MATVVRPSHAVHALALTAACVAGAAFLAASGAEAAPTPATLTAVPLAAAPATATGDITMTVATREGLLRGDSDSDGTFYVDSLAWGVASPVSTTIGNPRISTQTVTVARPVGVGSGGLISSMAAGRRLTAVTVSLKSAEGAQRPVTVVTYRLQNCVITGLDHAAGTDAKAQEKVTLVCESTTYGIRPLRADGSLGTEIPSRIISNPRLG